MTDDRSHASHPSPMCPATFLGALDELIGEFVQLTLQYPISSIPGGNLPIGRLIAVGSDYLTIDRAIVNGVRLRGFGAVVVRQATVFAVAHVRLEEVVVDLAVVLPAPGAGPGC